ncbi:MAG: KUP/HAK/KT family potassium transporter [Bacteroidota bacterium]|nr:KUP/HAK/KT family potassium transporter [Bacteroidota bacterium]
MKNNKHSGSITGLSVVGLIVSLGIIYGDIGTSPLYVMKAILSWSSGINLDFILGSISCIIWTLTLQTTLKYIIITLRADNKGEGGIFALYALIKRRAKWAYVFAIIGGSALLADGVITPSITVVSATEGLKLINPDITILPIAIAILTFVFIAQQFGTSSIGMSYGPIMAIWFLMLGVLGFAEIIKLPEILKAINPYYAYNLLTHYPKGILLLGAVFLCTTGAEALYSDLGHCGLKNIRVSWVYVKACLILNYLGQGAWALNNKDIITSETNPFYAIMPAWFLIPGIIIATLAAIIASQALISGSFTIISEAIRLNFWPKVKIKYPTTVRGQLYVPSINWFLWFACIFVVLFFRNSSNMEAAYGLSITITMLMTTVLVGFYLRIKKVPVYLIGLFISVYLMIEGTFLYANLYKFTHGGWFTILLAGSLLFVMYVWFRGRLIKNRFYQFEKVDKYIDVIKDMSKDESIPKYATNLIFITNTNSPKEIEAKIVYSILNKQPKRADVYWFVHVDNVYEPYRMEYMLQEIAPGIIYRIDFHLGFQVEPRINLFFRQVIEEMVKNNEINMLSRYESLKKHNITSDFKFVVIDRIQTYDFDFNPFEQFIMDIYDVLKKFGIPDVKAFGLDTSNVITETVPLVVYKNKDLSLKRIFDNGHNIL